MRHPIELELHTLDDTLALARKFAAILKPADCLLLEGEIGAGKSAFCRALIQSKLGQLVDVPSPTFTLVQVYDAHDVEIWHCDLYRLTDPEEAFELGLDDAFETAICLIEWPDRLGSAAPKDASLLSFSAQETMHTVTLNLGGDLLHRFHGS